jgi:hypothetical protein
VAHGLRENLSMIAPETLAAALRVAQHGAQHAMRAASLVPAPDAALRPPEAPGWGVAGDALHTAHPARAENGAAPDAPWAAALPSEIAGPQHHRHARA